MAWSMGTTNAWADRVDGEEEEAPAPPPPAFGAEESFPSLGEAAKVPPPTKKDKKKGGKPKPMSLADFNTGAYKAPAPAGGAYRAGAGYGRPKPSDDEILNMLPKGPSGYTQEDTSGGLGGGFKEYGGNRGGGYGDRERNDREERPRRDRDEEGRRGEREEQGPSRADEADDWGASRKFVPSEPRRGGGGFDGDRRFDREPREREEDMGPSRADESSNWGRDRKPLPPPEGRGFSDRYGDDRGGPADDGSMPLGALIGSIVSALALCGGVGMLLVRMRRRGSFDKNNTTSFEGLRGSLESDDFVNMQEASKYTSNIALCSPSSGSGSSPRVVGSMDL